MRSPDLNPIEQLWDMLKQRLKRCDSPPRSLKELNDANQLEWHELPEEASQNLTFHLTWLMQEISQKVGTNTRY